MGYSIAEHRDVMLPVNVCHDGNYLSFGATRVDLPAQAEVDAFLGAPNINWHAALDPARPMAVDPLTGGAGGPGPRTFVSYRKGQCAGMQNALAVISDAHEEWARRIGREHAPLVERYRMDDADVALVTLGSMTGAAKDAVDEARERGVRVGPGQGQDLPAVPGAGDRRRAVRHQGRRRGRPLGLLRLELRPALPGRRRRAAATPELPLPSMSFIGGLAGADLTTDALRRRDRARRGAGARRAAGPDRVAQRERLR